MSKVFEDQLQNIESQLTGRYKQLVSGATLTGKSVSKTCNQANKSTGWMPMAPSAEEGRGKLRKAWGSRKQA